MAAKKSPTAQAQQKTNTPAFAPNSTDLGTWLRLSDSSLEMLASVLFDSATKGSLEKTLHGVVTIRYDDATVRTITEAVGKIRGALATSQAVWLPGAEETQAQHFAARSDQRFQDFLAGAMGQAPQVKTASGGAA